MTWLSQSGSPTPSDSMYFFTLLSLFVSRSSLRVPSMSHGVLAKLVTKLLDEKSQFPCSLGFLLQKLITEAGNILLDFLQLTFNADMGRQTGSVDVSVHRRECKQKRHTNSTAIVTKSSACVLLHAANCMFCSCAVDYWNYSYNYEVFVVVYCTIESNS